MRSYPVHRVRRLSSPYEMQDFALKADAERRRAELWDAGLPAEVVTFSKETDGPLNAFEIAQERENAGPADG